MLINGALTFQEFIMGESVPLATVHRAVFEYLRGRDDAALCGAQAVNAYAGEPRMTQDIDLLSPRAEALAAEIRDHLHHTLGIAVRVRRVKQGLGYRLYQVTKPKNRHLVDVRSVEELPPTRRVEGVLAVAPAELIAGKVIAYARRRGRPKAFTDRRDLSVLLLAFPELKRTEGPVTDRLIAAGADEAALAAWQEIVATEILPEEDDEF